MSKQGGIKSPITSQRQSYNAANMKSNFLNKTTEH